MQLCNNMFHSNWPICPLNPSALNVYFVAVLIWCVCVRGVSVCVFISSSYREEKGTLLI